MGDMADKLAQFPQRAAVLLGDEHCSYRHVKCTGCEYASKCPYVDHSDLGCRMRRKIYEDEFAKVEFKVSDPITKNNLSIGTRYWVDLTLLREFGIPLTSEEIMLFRSLMGMMTSLYADKKGDLVDEKSKSAVPWEEDDQVKALRAEVESARADRSELEKLRKEKQDEIATDPV